MRQHRAILHALEQIMIRGRTFVLDSWAALQVPQVWAQDAAGGVVGHILTISDDALHDAADWLVAPLAVALDEPWSNPDERGAWTAAYIESLRSVADKAEAVERAFQDRAVLRNVSGLDPDEDEPVPRRTV